MFWHWWVLGLMLIVVELLAPGAFFLWFGIRRFRIWGFLQEANAGGAIGMSLRLF